MSYSDRIDMLKEVVNDIENFPERVNVHYTPLEKSRLNSLLAHKRELEGSDYYSSLARNAVEHARGAKNPYLKRLLLERSKDYKELALKRKTKACSYLAIDAVDSLSYQQIDYYKRINARSRKLLESIADKFSNEIYECVVRFEDSHMKSIRKRIAKSIYNLVMLAQLLQICVGDNFVTILPPNYYATESQRHRG